jgi:hypothetical protein
MRGTYRSQLICAALHELGTMQPDIADMAGVHVRTVRRAMTGEIPNERVEVATCGTLGVNVRFDHPDFEPRVEALLRSLLSAKAVRNAAAEYERLLGRPWPRANEGDAGTQRAAG